MMVISLILLGIITWLFLGLCGIVLAKLYFIIRYGWTDGYIEETPWFLCWWGPFNLVALTIFSVEEVRKHRNGKE